MDFATVAAMLCLAAATVIGAFVYAPDIARALDAVRRALRPRKHRPRR